MAKLGIDKINNTPTIQPDYALDDADIETTVIAEAMAAVLPQSRDHLAGGMADFRELGLTLEGYQALYESTPIRKSVNKLAVRSTEYELRVNRTDTEYAQWHQEVANQMFELEHLIENFTWANIDGCRFHQIKRNRASDGLTPMVVPDFTGGERKKSSAGGSIKWDGTKLVEVQQFSVLTDARNKARLLPTREFVIHKPSPTSNPEGDEFLIKAFIALAQDYLDGRKQIRSYARYHALGYLLIKKDLEGANPDQVDTLLTDAISSIKKQIQAQVKDQAKTNQRYGAQGRFAFSKEDIVEMHQPGGKGADDLLSILRYYEGIVDQMVLLNLLTSDTRESGASGSSQVHKSEEDVANIVNLKKIVGSMSRSVIPWIDFYNVTKPDKLPDEPDIWYEFKRRSDTEETKQETDDINSNNPSMTFDVDGERISIPNEPDPRFNDKLELIHDEFIKILVGE